MANYNLTYPMVLNNVYLGMISIRSDVADYFGIPAPNTTELSAVKYRGEIKAHSRNIFSQRLDASTTAPTRQVAIDKKTGISRERGKNAKNRGGKPFKIPTQLTSTPQTIATTDAGAAIVRQPQIRHTTIRFPGEASIGEVSAWLHLKLVTKKPVSFQSPGGKTYSVSPLAAGAVVSGGDTTP